MKWTTRMAVRAATISLFFGAAFAVPASAQRVQDVTPLPATAPATTTPATPAVEASSAPASESAGPRVRAEIPRVEPVLEARADASAATRKDNMNTITISTVALVLLVILIVLLVK